jgi:hypothetical protein
VLHKKNEHASQSRTAVSYDLQVWSPYLTLWPQFEKLGERDGGLVFLSNDNWIQSADVFARVGGVPEALAVQCSAYAHDTFGPNLDRVYPPVWPFGMTHADLQR